MTERKCNTKLGTNRKGTTSTGIIRTKRKSREKRLFVRLSLWSVLFLSGGQHLFGCSHMKAAQEQWGAVGVATIQAQRDIELKSMELATECGGECEEPESTTIEAPITLNIPEQVTKIKGYTKYLEDGTEVSVPEQTITQTDHTALGMLLLGQANENLAKVLGKIGTKVPVDNSPQKERGIIYSLPPQPASDTVSGIISSSGDALSKQSWLGRLVETGFFVSGMKSIAKNPSHVITNSNNPTTVTNPPPIIFTGAEAEP